MEAVGVAAHLFRFFRRDRLLHLFSRHRSLAAEAVPARVGWLFQKSERNRLYLSVNCGFARWRTQFATSESGTKRTCTRRRLMSGRRRPFFERRASG